VKRPFSSATSESSAAVSQLSMSVRFTALPRFQSRNRADGDPVIVAAESSSTDQ
jgi:hypothetical protein